jgi:ribonuclease HI
MKVKIFIESTWNGPVRRDGVAMWLIEYLKNDIPVTRQGFIHLENGTETQGNLMAMINAICTLKKPCQLLVFTRCEHIFYAVKNQWDKHWIINHWKNAKGEMVKNHELWQLFTDKVESHTYSIKNESHEYQRLMQTESKKELETWKNRRYPK